jgi:histidinol phosphatase-like enzyme (inositol monophosphatase family)
MTIDSTELKDLLDFAVNLAREGGKISLGHYKGSFTVEQKADSSFVTAADREIERHWRESIERRFPADAIIGEEEGVKSGTSGRSWIIDPIDGTYSFVHGVPLFAMLIGLESAGVPVLGVANLPALDELVYAAKGLGCFWNDRKTKVSTTASLGEALLLATDFSSCVRYEFGDAAQALQTHTKTWRTWGDAYGHILVATGRADIMLDPIMNVWDCAALLPIVEEAGGTFTDWKGNPTIHGGNAISTNGRLFAQVMATVRSPLSSFPC